MFEVTERKHLSLLVISMLIYYGRLLFNQHIPIYLVDAHPHDVGLSTQDFTKSLHQTKTSVFT